MLPTSISPVNMLDRSCTGRSKGKARFKKHVQVRTGQDTSSAWIADDDDLVSWTDSVAT
jgi:hypothetical protein